MRIALVGIGRWGSHILRDLVSLGCDVTVVARSSSSRERAVVGGAHAIVEDVTALGEVDGVVVATPVPTHAEVVARVLLRGVPVFVEKPLTDDPASARDLAERAGGRLFVMDKWRYHPAIEAMAAMARSNEHGKVRAIHSRRLSWGHDHPDTDAMWVLLPHDLAIVREIAGWLPEACAAVASAWSTQQASLTGLLGPDPACTVEVSSLSPIRERRVLVEFDHAVALWDDRAGTEVRVVRNGSTHDVAISVPSDMPLLRELSAFVDHLRGGPPPRSSSIDGAEAVARVARLRELAGL